ncbi:hypothetical protein [Sphingomonas sp. R86521]|uniref:hypothetical protein n=1 Tax=Sphingomonas sp. R86521 TaxID=3093860 RepID=UPI0036D21919
MPSYASAADFTYDRSFTAIGLSLTTPGGSTPPTAHLDQASPAIGLDFTAATRTYRARYNDASITVVTQPTVTAVPTTAGSVPTDIYSNGPISFLRSPVVLLANNTSNQPTSATYIGYIKWVDQERVRYQLFGARTVPANIPTQNPGRLPLTHPGSCMVTVISKTGQQTEYATISGVTIDFRTNQVQGGANWDQTTGLGGFAIDGVLDSTTGRISGTASVPRFDGKPSDSTGSFEGALFGFSYSEVALLVTISNPDGSLLYGLIGWTAQ